MTVALYRRYRPECFQEVIGQTHVTEPLMTALRTGKTTHAYLFSGPRGCGKTTSARILARCINCAEGPTDTPCGKCESCQELACGGSGSLDVVEIDAASHGGVDDVRDLHEQASFAPVRDRYKVFIIDEAHMVSNQGFNAMLKLVEEPPEHVKFVFATTEPEKVIGTIRSRTHHYPFRLVPPDILEHHLSELCKKEKLEVSPGVFPLVIRAGGGSVRDTLSVIDQLIGGQDDGKLDYQRTVNLLGFTPDSLLDQSVDALCESDGAHLFEVLDQVVNSGLDTRRFMEDLLQRLRDLVIIGVTKGQAEDIFHGYAPEQIQKLKEQAISLGPPRASRSADLISQAIQSAVGVVSGRIQIELLGARLLLPGAITGPEGYGARIDSLEAKVDIINQPDGIKSKCSKTDEGYVSSPGKITEVTKITKAPEISQANTVNETLKDDTKKLSDPNSPSAFSRGEFATRETSTSELKSGEESKSDSGKEQKQSGANTINTDSREETDGSAIENVASSPIPSTEPNAEISFAVLEARWEEVLSVIRQTIPTHVLVSQHAKPHSLMGSTLQIELPSTGLVNTFRRGGHLELVERALHTVFKTSLSVNPHVKGEYTGEEMAESGTSVPSNQDIEGSTSIVGESNKIDPATPEEDAEQNNGNKTAFNTAEVSTSVEEFAADNKSSTGEEAEFSKKASATQPHSSSTYSPSASQSQVDAALASWERLSDRGTKGTYHNNVEENRRTRESIVSNPKPVVAENLDLADSATSNSQPKDSQNHTSEIFHGVIPTNLEKTQKEVSDDDVDWESESEAETPKTGIELVQEMFDAKILEEDNN